MPGPNGRWFTPSIRTIERKLAIIELRDPERVDVVRRPRKDKGEPAVLLTRRWDRATAGRLSDPECRRIADATKQAVRDLWGSGAGYSAVQRLASEGLANVTYRAGLDDLSADQLAAVCQLPKHFVEAGRFARRVHERRTNIKAWDNERPRVRLTSDRLEPMQIVYGDVHHLDVYVRREDGSLATPKGIAWLDAANRRLRIDLVLCEPGTSIRNADLIQSFIDMTQDPTWGVPQNLYLDNGSEYRFAAFLEDPMALAGLGCKVFETGGPVVRARAYNAAAKGILEGSFRILEQTVLAPLKGYIGGDRMKSRSANLGKAPEPFAGTFEDFVKVFAGLLLFYNTNRQKGDLKGVAPIAAFNKAVAAGWRRTDVDGDALRTLFSTAETRIVLDGKIKVGGQVFYADRLFRHNGEKVTIQRPKFLKWDGVPVFTSKGQFIDVARLDDPYPRGSLDGAREAEHSRRLAVETIDELERTLNRVDVSGAMAASAARSEPEQKPASAGTITLVGTSPTIGRRIAQGDAETADPPRRSTNRERLAILQKYQSE